MTDERARRIADLLRSRETMGGDWGILVEDACEGYARIACTIRPHMLNGHGSAHGGALFTLADTAFAYACNSHGENAVAYAATINFLSPAKPGDHLIAEAQELMRAGRSGSYVVSIRTEDGRPIASFHGLSRCLGSAIEGLED